MIPSGAKKAPTTERAAVGGSQQPKGGSRQRQDSKRKTPTYYDSLMRFQQSEMGPAGHNRAVTSIGMATKFTTGAPTGKQGHWQQVNQVRIPNHSQPPKPGATAKKGNSGARNPKSNNFGNYAAATGKVVQGGVTNFNVYQHI
jgi:hypothetical protein